MTAAAVLILGWLSLNGYAPAQRDAALVAAAGESRFDPGARSPAGDVGLYQWRGPRKAALAAYELRRLPGLAGERPELARRDLRTVAQLEFMDREWRAMPASAAFFAVDRRDPAFLIFCRDFLRRARCP